MTITEYRDLLKNHDITYEYSDDPHQYRAGSNSQRNIIKYRNLTPKHTELYLNHKTKLPKG
jgi:hypothetical protein